MFVLTCLALTTAALIATPLPGDGDEAPHFADELPGYYAFYKRAGTAQRLDDELARDRSLEQQGEWLPVQVEAPAPRLSLPGSDGRPIPLRVGGPGRYTVVTTFQSWW